MAPQPTADPGHWFLRGVQSAIFYYVSLTPCLDYKYKRKRRKEARQDEKVQAGIVTDQPGLKRQPMAFQTNEQWAEELMLGPGPPKGWEKDNLLKKLKKRGIQIPISSKSELHTDQKFENEEPSPPPPALQTFDGSTTVNRSNSNSQERSLTSSRVSTGTTTTTTLAPAVDQEKAQIDSTRPTMERRLSTAVEHFKDTLKSSLHPDRWNWHRYDREDEELSGVAERKPRIWSRATNANVEEKENAASGRKRAWTNDSDRYDYARARNPAINDLHPPVVSQLPATRAEAAWMLLPPPSAAVMAGRTRPGAELGFRWPICVMGRPRELNNVSKAFPNLETASESNQILAKDEDGDETFSAYKNHGNDKESVSGNESDIEYDQTSSIHEQQEKDPPRTLSLPQAALMANTTRSPGLESSELHYFSSNPNP